MHGDSGGTGKEEGICGRRGNRGKERSRDQGNIMYMPENSLVQLCMRIIALKGQRKKYK